MNPLLYRRSMPLALTTILAVFLMANYFMNLGPGAATIERLLLSFTVVILTAALGLGMVNLVRFHVRRIQSRDPGVWQMSVILLVCFAFMMVVGIGYGAGSNAFNLVWQATMEPLGATLMALFIVWLAPGFARAIRIRNVTGAITVVALTIVLTGASPLGQIIPFVLPISDWISTVLNKAGSRGIAITIAMGLLVMSARILLGKEKSYLREG